MAVVPRPAKTRQSASGPDHAVTIGLRRNDGFRELDRDLGTTAMRVVAVILIQEQGAMRRQARPFVEVKHKRAPSKKQSIWGNLNIAAAAETMHGLEQDELASGFLIDSDAASIDVAGDDSQPVELLF